MQKLLWALRQSISIVVLDGVFAMVVLWDTLPEAFAATVGGEQGVQGIRETVHGDQHLLIERVSVFIEGDQSSVCSPTDGAAVQRRSGVSGSG